MVFVQYERIRTLLSVLEKTYKHFYCAEVSSLVLNYTNVLFEDMHVRIVKFAPRMGQTNFMTPYAYNWQSSLHEIIVRGTASIHLCFRVRVSTLNILDKFL